MYIHRIVIDANQINTRGKLEAMNQLEALHNAGVVEIYQTSTLQYEFQKWTPGKNKAKQYTVISGNIHFLSNVGNFPYCVPGTSGCDSKFHEILREVFGSFSSDKEKPDHDMRDALHIDQANQHDADFFITDEKAILRSASALYDLGITPKICSAEDCLSTITAYFNKSYGTSDLLALTHRLNQEGPIFLGSNICANTAIMDLKSNEILLAFKITNSGVIIKSTIRAEDGTRLLDIEPNQPFSFTAPGAEISMETGPAPILLGEQYCRSFAITASGYPRLAGRMLKNGRLLIYTASLFNKAGHRVLHIERDSIALSSGTIGTYT
jgi:hypothetical protein